METPPAPDDPGPTRRPRARRWLLALGALVLLLVAAWLGVQRAYPPERLASMLSESVSTTTGRAFRIDGTLKLRLFPTITLEATDVALANVDWGTAPDMVRARRVAFEISLRDLFSGRLRIESVDIDGADIRFEGDGTGRYNWRLAPRQKSAGSPAPRISLDRLAATDAHVRYLHAKGGIEQDLGVESLVISAAGDRSQLDATLVLGSQRWKVDGKTGPIDALLASTAEWPLDLKAATEGATATVQGSMGTGNRAGAFDAKVSVRVESAAALTPHGAAAAMIPLPLEWQAAVTHSPGLWRADQMQVSSASHRLGGSATLKTGVGVPLRIEADLAATTIGVPRLPALSSVKAQVAYQPGRLQIEPFSFAIAGGQARGQVRISLPSGAAPAIDLQLNARSMSIDALETAYGGPRHFKGGQAQLDAKLAMTGRTAWALAGSSTGNVLLTARDVGLTGRAASLDRDLIARLIDALIPSGQPRDNLAMQCVVVRLPLRNGVAAVDRSIAVETRQIAVSASGEINLARRTLSLAFRPQVKRGLDLNPGSLVELMLLQGPIDAPELSINPKGAVRQAANVGVAAATGGISLLAPMLRSATGESSVCTQALGKTAATPQPEKKEARRRLLPWPKITR